MTRKTAGKTDARMLQRTYATPANGLTYQTLLNLVRDRGLDGAIAELGSARSETGRVRSD